MFLAVSRGVGTNLGHGDPSLFWARVLAWKVVGLASYRSLAAAPPLNAAHGRSGFFFFPLSLLLCLLSTLALESRPAVCSLTPSCMVWYMYTQPDSEPGQTETSSSSVVSGTWHSTYANHFIHPRYLAKQFVYKVGMSSEVSSGRKL